MRDIVWILLVCGGCQTGPWDRVESIDEGNVCFQQDGDQVIAIITAPDCLSSSCSRDVEGTCAVDVEGAVVTLQSEISWEVKSGRFVTCTDDCGIATTSCPVGPLADGVYTVHHGDAELELEVPAAENCAF